MHFRALPCTSMPIPRASVHFRALLGETEALRKGNPSLATRPKGLFSKVSRFHQVSSQIYDEIGIP